MESKHTYFKKVVKSSKNLINVAKTCATRHELSQVCHKYTGLFPTNKLEIPPQAVSLDACRDDSENPVLIEARSKFAGDSLILNKVKVFGTCYTLGSAVFLRKQYFGEYQVGVIKGIILFQNGLFFLCRVALVAQNEHNIYQSTHIESENVWVQLEKLLDYYPVTTVGSQTSFKLLMHHFVSEK